MFRPSWLPQFFAIVAWLALQHPASGQHEVTVSLSGSDQGRIFEGVGAVSAGASSRLLADYAEPYRSDILDFLFKPKFGAGFQHLKVEIGGGENSTCGSEPSHAISREELSQPKERGYELWLMKEARARQPGILLECLPWTYPAWVEGAFTPAATDWFVAFLDLARKQQTPLDWVSAAWNEKGTDRDWIVNSLRPTLDAKGYQAVRLQAPDDLDRYWQDFEKYGEDAAYQAAVTAVGYHYVNGREPWTIDQPGHPATAKAKASGKPLWNSEEWSQSGKEWGGVGAFYAARVLNKMYVRDRITKTELWCPIAAFYPTLPWGGTGPMEASSPWSGHYTVWPGIWAIAHTTQFAQPGWQYLDHACGQISPATWKGTYVSLKDPATHDWSTIVCTDEAVRIAFKVGDDLKQGPVHVWHSNDKAQFVQEADLSPAKDGTYAAQLEAASIYSFTTSTGQTKGVATHPIPDDKPFPFPFQEDFKNYAAGQTPKYFSDYKGTFETVQDSDKGMCLTQIVPREGICWDGGMHVPPCTVFGDGKWTDYTISADVKIANGQVEIGARAGADEMKALAYRWVLAKSGTWQLLYQRNILVSGTLADFDPTVWHTLKFVMKGAHLEGWADGVKVVERDDAKKASGLANLGSSYDPNRFANVAVGPAQ